MADVKFSQFVNGSNLQVTGDQLVGLRSGINTRFSANNIAGVTQIQNGSYVHAVDTGVANAYVININPVPTGYIDGQLFTFRAANTNTGASTINISGLGVIAIAANGGIPLTGGEILADGDYIIVINSVYGSAILVNSATTDNIVNTNSKYVAPQGSDTAGDGSILNPYKTIAFAISTITTATDVNPFNVVLIGGFYQELSVIALKPHVNLCSYTAGTVIDNLSPIGLDPTWDTVANPQVNIENLQFGGSIFLDFATVPLASNGFVWIKNIKTLGLFTVNGSTAPMYVFMYDSYITDFVMNNIYVQSFNNFYTFSFTAGNIPFTTNSFLFSTSDYYNTSPTLNGAAAGLTTQQYDIRSSVTELPIDIGGNGANVTLNIDASTYLKPNITSLNPTIVLTTIGNSINADYTPVNYTPDAAGGTDPVNSVSAHLHGIDNKFSTLTGGVVTNDKWVSNQGSNVSGNGTVENPWQTIAYALTQIVTNSNTNIFRIVCTSGIYNETALALKPWVYLEGNGATLNTSGAITLDGSFLVVGGDIIISNFYNCDFVGNMTLDVEATVAVVPTTITIQNLTMFANLLITVKGADPSTSFTTFLMTGTESLAGAVSVSLKNVAGFIYSSIVSTMAYNATNASVGYAFEVSDTYFTGAVALQTVGGIGCFLTFNSNTLTSTLSASGVGTVLRLDANSISNISIPSIFGGASVVLFNVANGLATNYTPTNFTATDLSVKGAIEGIDNALATAGVQSLQQTYSTGANAEVTVLAARPAKFKNANASFATDIEKDDFKIIGLGDASTAFIGIPVATVSNVNDRMEGFVFTPNTNLFATQFQYYGLNTASRLLGLWQVGNTTPLATATMTPFDINSEQLIQYKTLKINPPIPLASGTQYIIAAVVPAGELIYSGAVTGGVNPFISISAAVDSPNSSVLTYPNIVPASAGLANGGASIGLSLTTPETKLDADYTGLTTINSFRSTVYPGIVSFNALSAATLQFGLFQRVDNVVNVSARYSVTPTASSSFLVLAVPYNTTIYPSIFYATGDGTLTRVVGATVSNAGIINTIVSASGTPYVQINFFTQPPFGNAHFLQVNFSYQII